MSDENADKNPADKGGNNQRENLPPPDGNEVVNGGTIFSDIVKLLGECGFCLWIIVDLVRDAEAKWWIKVLLWLAVVIVAFDIAHRIYLKIWPKKCQVFTSYSILVLALLVVAFRPIPVPSAPHFTVSVRTVGFPSDTSLPLDKGFLHTFKAPTVLNWKYIRGRLLVPIANAHSGVTLRFSIFNDNMPLADSPL